VTILDLLFEAWPDETPPPVARFRDAIEKTYAAAHVLGLDAEAIYAAQAPFAMRCDAWMWRTSKLLRSPP
jgi:hypothetical protein